MGFAALRVRLLPGGEIPGIALLPTPTTGLLIRLFLRLGLGLGFRFPTAALAELPVLAPGVIVLLELLLGVPGGMCCYPFGLFRVFCDIKSPIWVD